MIRQSIYLATGLLLVLFGEGWRQTAGAAVSVVPNEDAFIYLPVALSPSLAPVGDNLLANPSFEEGWTDLPPAPGNLINQQPNDWVLSWVEPGEPIFGSDDLAGGVPECIHKLIWQLPPDEQPGGPNALILDGEATYKVFHFGLPFGVELSQTVTGLTPGTLLQLTVPIQVHLHGDTKDPFTAESGIWVNGVGHWVNSKEMGDRTWYEHMLLLTVPEDGTVEVVIRFKSKWSRPKDFFIDDLQLVVLEGVANSRGR